MSEQTPEDLRRAQQPVGATTPGYQPEQEDGPRDPDRPDHYTGTPSFGVDDPERVDAEVQAGGSPTATDARD
ncbi:hypothetical protein [Vallicoccus soli]|uniref:Uncharacterized protein n=1 Tax=Vallicoccus soli TaxID=2339232 RepID=A0A3A3YZ75_9ACTN|nr:hypothetical protein [Vallicoccus soli]RJK96050.1 hypothetical protein D5H78_10865 [Vallicoccus soli]